VLIHRDSTRLARPMHRYLHQLLQEPVMHQRPLAILAGSLAIAGFVLAAPTRAEPGCIVYDLYQSPDVPHEFMRFEVWQDAAALERHKATPHLRASFAKRQREGWTTQILTWQRVPE
jgi:quinol monooxygenase YgiN